MAESRASSLPLCIGQRPRTSRVTSTGYITVVAFLGGLAAWSYLAPLQSAALAPGVIGVESRVKTVEHLEGGIIRSIQVREGERVVRGQTLVELDPTSARTSLEILKGQRLALMAKEARLIAEQTENAKVEFPIQFASGIIDARVLEVVAGEIKIFRAHQRALASQISVLEQEKGQFTELIEGLNRSIEAQGTQLNIIREEIDLYQYLLERGLTQKPRVLELKRKAAEIEDHRILNETEIARTKQRMAEIELRIHELRDKRTKDAAEELRKVQTERFGLDTQIIAAQDVLNRTVITAPIAGNVVALKVHTPGGVIEPGGSVLTIVPADDRLLVDARIDPDDIDVVHSGLLAEVYLTAFHKRHMQPLRGRVLSVSADRLIEERTGQAYYLARIELTQSANELPDALLLYPGMGAEVMIVTGMRTAIEYLLEPITSSFNRAFRDSLLP